MAKELELLANTMEQAQYDRIVGYLRTGKCLSSMTKNENDSLRRIEKNGLIFYRDKKKARTYRLILQHAGLTSFLML